MSAVQPRYSMEEFASRGERIYEEQIRPQVEPEHLHKFVAIDIETGDYEVDRDDYAATPRLRTRRPDAQIWMMRAGHPTAYRMGGTLQAPVRPVIASYGWCLRHFVPTRTRQDY
jgi:hypothetical protein